MLNAAPKKSSDVFVKSPGIVLFEAVFFEQYRLLQEFSQNCMPVLRAPLS